MLSVGLLLLCPIKQRESEQHQQQKQQNWKLCLENVRDDIDCKYLMQTQLTTHDHCLSDIQIKWVSNNDGDD